MKRPLDLMRLHDGELTEDELAELEAADERALEGLEQLGDVLRAHTDARSEAADGIADQVMARLDETESEPVRAPSPKPRVRAGASSTSTFPALERVAPVVAMGLALAAAAAWMLWLKSGVDTTTRPTPIVQTVEPSPIEKPEPIAQVDVVDDDGPPAVSIEAVDFGNHAGTIFMVPAGESAASESTPVVWLEDEPAGARMERL